MFFYFTYDREHSKLLFVMRENIDLPMQYHEWREEIAKSEYKHLIFNSTRFAFPNVNPKFNIHIFETNERMREGLRMCESDANEIIEEVFQFAKKHGWLK